MIGVIEDKGRCGSIEELFQLFKTPWEFAVAGRNYDVIIATTRFTEEFHASAYLVFQSNPMEIDETLGITLNDRRSWRFISINNEPVPLFRESSSIASCHAPNIVYHGTNEVAAVRISTPTGVIVRLGYDIFNEVEHLLTKGQPIEMAAFPTLDMHIAIIRQIILSLGLSILEIPPTPPGYAFMVALTHDVDFAGIRRHGLDHTLLGFLCRATVGSLVRWITCRLSFKEMIQNWITVLKLPFIMAGRAKDIWDQYDEYIKIEGGQKSTFFIIPYKNRAGKGINAAVMKKRASPYDVADLLNVIDKIRGQGKEIALHGIDAWCDLKSAISEKERIENSIGIEIGGARIHWLYFSTESPAIMEKAGFSYDSSVGYNETIGFKAGTLHPYRPLNCYQLLELPLHIQDAAMFFKAFKNWPREQAWQRCQRIFDAAERFGGAVTLLWHERSLGPERQWGSFYKKLMAELSRRNAWATSCQEIAAWFLARRKIKFESVRSEELGIHLRLSGLDSVSSFEFRICLQRGDNLPSFETSFRQAGDIFLAFASGERFQHECVSQ